MGYAQWGATIFSLIYLYYAIKNNPICFVWGILGSAIWAYVSFSEDLVFDGALQLFYILMSVVGIFRWISGDASNRELPISSFSWRQHLIIISIGVLLSYGLSMIAQRVDFITFYQPILDATTTIFLIIGTILLVERKLHSWVYLVIADIGYIFLYSFADLWLFVAVMIVYIICGIVGFYSWRDMYDRVG